MNERIFKLALEAMDFQGAVDIDTELKLTNSELEKFAELIVRECMKVVINGKYSATECERNTHRIAHNNARDESSSDIKKHFGVEE